MSEEEKKEIKDTKPSFGQRLARAFAYGISAGFCLYVLGALAGGVVSTLPALIAEIGFGVGFGSAVGIELSKDMK